NLHVPFGAHRLTVAGDPGYLVEGRELVYQVRWDAPRDAIQILGPAVTYPGDPPPVVYQEPGWLVDRATREVHPVDLSTGALAWYTGPRRAYPLPPGWRPGTRPSLAGCFAAQLAALLPPQFAGPLVDEAVARYTARLAGPDWPDFVTALRVAWYTTQALAQAGPPPPDLAAAAVLLARGPGPDDTLLSRESALWHSTAGALARTPPAAGAPRLVRALALANAHARATVDSELFGTVPRANLDELSALGPLAFDLPALAPATATGSGSPSYPG
ncbi:MAG TPA: hypothetical protein VJT31_02535, partial [Rugosimonospora sp.]|nr:hypothetical protein [Rugosimonospora sp.]